jgi:ABC-type tungstate transport system permease subunit
MIKLERPDVLVTEIALPGEDGYELIRQIRQHEADHGGLLPAVALTSYARAEDQARVLAAGFQLHLSKPIDPIDLTTAVNRRDVMYNDFVVVGPKADPAGVKGMKDAVAALKKISAAKAPFASRGDKSGTHSAELRLWQAGGIDPKGDWYRETGSGMGPTLNTASGMNAYALADRGTWLAFKNRGGLAIVVEGDERLFNQYGIMLVNSARHPHVKAAAGLAFIDWVVSLQGQAAIGAYKIGGVQLFFPNAKG